MPQCVCMRTSDLDFHLPPELIAQAPAAERSASRLLHYRRGDRSIAHRRFSDLPGLLRPGDVLVFNDAQVVPARFVLLKSTGGRVEGLFLGEKDRGLWEVLLKNAGRADALRFKEAPQVPVRIVEQAAEGRYIIAVATDEPALVLLSKVGRMPLPPYIKRDKDHDARDQADRERYQTVYARVPGAVAAPTAGLHFTGALLDELAARGVERAVLTLHVGLGTFKPITSDDLDEHAMHVESYSMDDRCAEALNRARRDRRRIVAVGTTSARVLESQPEDRPFAAVQSETGIFIRPSYRWKHVDALITNFHLPRSTLIALVAALVGLDEQRCIYQTAIAQRYRFFSYGDAMFVE
jgi:S-adenosylmethionine:tRNA ribosyltransferase-isomerase